MAMAICMSLVLSKHSAMVFTDREMVAMNPPRPHTPRLVNKGGEMIGFSKYKDELRDESPFLLS
jgi:hypothetical protein